MPPVGQGLAAEGGAGARPAREPLDGCASGLSVGGLLHMITRGPWSAEGGARHCAMVLARAPSWGFCASLCSAVWSAGSPSAAAFPRLLRQPASCSAQSKATLAGRHRWQGGGKHRASHVILGETASVASALPRRTHRSPASARAPGPAGPSPLPRGPSAGSFPLCPLPGLPPQPALPPSTPLSHLG